MLRYLSDRWIDEFGQTAAASSALNGIMAGTDLDQLVIEQVITDPPDDLGSDAIAYHLVLGHSAAAVKRGRAEQPAVSFTQSYDTAQAIATGHQSAQAAFMSGDLRLGGRVDLLIAHHGVLVELDDIFAQLRDRTEW